MMKKFPAIAVVLCAAVFALRAQSARSVRDGVYNEAQAARGRIAYSQICMECHGRDLTGDVETRPLIGDEFTTNWSEGSLLRLFDRIRITMPADKAGTLSRQQVADILAFILQSNTFPAGKDELSTRSEVLDQIKFEIPK
ncbi:MAG TPA: cytochrome c [Bryobacteraceae bacterium]|nr:cytochrome c [Bryobacteraceae bacterium]